MARELQYQALCKAWGVRGPSDVILQHPSYITPGCALPPPFLKPQRAITVSIDKIGADEPVVLFNT